MPTIIALDTSSQLASVALYREGEVLSRESVGVKNHSQMTLPMVQTLLTDAGVALTACDAIAVAIGPGSFTGVRTACGIAQGLAFGSKLPVVPVITLAAMAQATRKHTDERDVLVLLDAMMGEVYWAQYRFTEKGMEELNAPALSAPADITAVGDVVVCGNGLMSYPKECAHLPALATFPEIMPHAIDVATIGAQLYANGKTVSAYDVQPLYLRNKVALTTKEREAQRGCAA